MEKVWSEFDASIRKNMLNVLERVRQEIRKVASRESTSQDRDAVSLEVPQLEKEDDRNLFEILAHHAEWKMIRAYWPGLRNRKQRDRSGEAVDSGESRGEGSSSQEDPPPPEDSAESSSQGSQSAPTPSQPDATPRSESQRARQQSSQPTGLAPRETRRRNNLSVLTARQSPTSPSSHDRARSSRAGSRSRSPREPIVPPSKPPTRRSTAPGPRDSRRVMEQRARIPSRFPEDSQDEELEYRPPRPLHVGRPQVPVLQIPLNQSEVDLISFDDGLPGSSRRSQDSDSKNLKFSRTSILERSRRVPMTKMNQDFETTKETQPSDQSPAPN